MGASKKPGDRKQASFLFVIEPKENSRNSSVYKSFNTSDRSAVSNYRSRDFYEVRDRLINSLPPKVQS